MPRHKVFICYSHRDKELFDQLLTHLDPYDNQHLLEIWTDGKILAGDEWRAEIFRRIAAADAAVVLVSPDLLASDFVCDHELPRLLQAREQGRLTLMPLFLRPAATDIMRFEVDGADGSREINLSEIQGLNPATEPLAGLEPAARDKALADAAKKLLGVLRALPRPDARPARRRRELTVALETRQDRLARSYGHPPYYDLHQGRGAVDLKHLESLARRSPHDLGQALFELLFGPGRERQQILSKAYGRQVSDPLRHAFRIRVHTNDAALRALPWALCRWRRHLLVDEGWTFELAAGDRPRPVEHLHTPCRALLVIGERQGRPDLLAGAHANGFESLLARAWDYPLKARLLHRARTLEQLETELAKPVDLLYLYGHAETRASSPALLLADGSALCLERMARLVAERPPRIVMLNTVGDCPLAPPLPGVAVTVHLRYQDDGAKQTAARGAAAAWWQAVLGIGLEPVPAFCELPETAQARGAIFTDYHEWKLDHSDYVPKVDRPRAHLDRRDQRRGVLDAVEDLVRDRRRVTCVVAYGAEGNLVEHFAVQIMATMKERDRGLARLQHVRLDLPLVAPKAAGHNVAPKAAERNVAPKAAERNVAPKAAGRNVAPKAAGRNVAKAGKPERAELGRGVIVENFRDTLGLQPAEPLSAAFGHRRRGGPHARPVHFFDWGTYGDGHGPPLVSGDLETWCLFCRDDLGGACPPDARVLAYLSLASDHDRHADLVKVVRALKQRHYQPHFDLVALPALGTVTAEDLLRFLADPGNSSCPPAFLEDLAERIARATEGSFETTVELLEQTEGGNRWFELAEELEEAPPRTELDKDIPL